MPDPSDIIYNRVGIVTKGDDTGKYIKLADDREGSTGGFYAYITDDLNDDSPVYDDWFEKMENLVNYLSAHEVKWLENETHKM
jgi:hypothetical protein